MSTTSTTSAPKSRRRWLQFSVRGLLVLVVVFRLGFGQLAPTFQLARAQGAEEPDGAATEKPVAQIGANLARWKAAVLAHDHNNALTAVDNTKSVGPRVIPALVTMLNAGNDRLARIFAAQVLEQFGTAAMLARESLLRNLRDQDPEVVVASMQALTEVSEYWPNDQVALLTQLVRDNTDLVRVHAINRLGHAGPRARSAIPVLLDVLEKDAWNNCRMHAATTLSYIAPKDPKVIAGLVHSAEQGNWAAIVALRRAGPAARPAVPLLIRTLNREIRESAAPVEAAKLLGEIGPSAAEAIPVLLKCMTDDDSRVASACAGALAQVGIANPEVVPALMRCAETGDQDVRTVAVRALGTLGPRARQAVPMLCGLLQDNRSKLRAEAARSLGMIDAPGGPSESLLRQCLEGSDDDTQRQSAIALALLGRENPDVLRLLSISLARRDFDALPALHSLPNGTQYFGPTLVKMMHDSNPTIRRYGVLAIGHLSNVPAETLRIVSEHLTDETLEVRMAAADALGRLGPMARSELAALQRALADDNWLVQEAAQRAIEKIR